MAVEVRGSSNLVVRSRSRWRMPRSDAWVRASTLCRTAPHWKDIWSTGEQTTKQGDLVGSWRTIGNRRALEERKSPDLFNGRQLTLQRGERRFKTRLLGVEVGETPPNAHDFLFDRISVHVDHPALFFTAIRRSTSASILLTSYRDL
jgi:hypothetical protein